MKRSFEIASEAEMSSFAAAFANVRPSNAFIGLSGTLGAGKTFFVREVASRLGADRETILSPTFTICNEYASSPKVYHLDLYRVRDEDEFYELGIDEMNDGDSIVFVEWADRFTSALPSDRLNLHIELTSETGRRVELSACGSHHERLAKKIEVPL